MDSMPPAAIAAWILPAYVAAGGCLCGHVRDEINAAPHLTIWTASAPSWTCIDPQIPQCSLQPPLAG